MTSSSPETLAEMARVDVQTALDEDRDDGETEQQTATRFLAEGVDGRWTPPSGDVNLEPTPESQAYWTAVRTHLEETARPTSCGVQVDEDGREPMTGEYIRVDQHPDGCRCPGHAAAPTPPPADGPGLAELMPMVLRLAEKHLPGALLADLRRALAAEEEREKLRLEAAEAIQALPDVIRIAQLDRRVSRWAAITLGREALPDEARADQRQARRDAALAWHGFPDDIRDDLVAKCDWEAIRKLDDWADAELGSTP